MRVTKKFLKSLGYVTVWNVSMLKQFTPRKGEPDETFSNDKYPFNNFRIHRKGIKFYIETNTTKYDCSDAHSLLSTVYFCGINDGEKKKRMQIKAALGIPAHIDL